MGLILIKDNKEIVYDKLTISDTDSAISLYNPSGELLLSVDLPFKSQKIHPKFKDLNSDFEDIYVFKNNYYNQLDICEFFIKEQNSPQERQAIFFKLSILTEPEAIKLIAKDKTLQVCIFRAVIKLLRNQVSVPARKLVQQRENLFSLYDFYDEDLIIGVFPFDWKPKMNNDNLTSFLYCSNRYGFYLMNNKLDFQFIPIGNRKHELNYHSILPRVADNRKRIAYNPLESEFSGNGFFFLFVGELIKRESDAISRFHMLYQHMEIINDTILKLELKKRICANPNMDDLSGYKLKKITSEISNESYRIDRYFTNYSECHVKNEIDITIELLDFLETTIEKTKYKDLNTFGKTLYELRNQIVHNLQFIYSGTAIEIKKKIFDIENLNNLIEYAIIDSIVHAKLN